MRLIFHVSFNPTYGTYFLSTKMTPEQRARRNIDSLLESAGWDIQNHAGHDTSATFGVAVREYPLRADQRADYLLFINGVAVGVIEAKPEGTTLSGALQQAERYRASLMYIHCCDCRPAFSTRKVSKRMCSFSTKDRHVKNRGHENSGSMIYGRINDLHSKQIHCKTPICKILLLPTIQTIARHGLKLSGSAPLVTMS